MIQYTSGGSYGNHFYVDEFTISDANMPVGVEYLNEDAAVKLYPNPTSGNTTLAFETPNAVQSAQLSVLDLTGRLVMNMDLGALDAGNHETHISSAQLPATGVYIVRLYMDGQVINRKLVVE
jgi:hypothetical protein